MVKIYIYFYDDDAYYCKENDLVFSLNDFDENSRSRFLCTVVPNLISIRGNVQFACLQSSLTIFIFLYFLLHRAINKVSEPQENFPDFVYFLVWTWQLHFKYIWNAFEGIYTYKLGQFYHFKINQFGSVCQFSHFVPPNRAQCGGSSKNNVANSGTPL